MCSNNGFDFFCGILGGWYGMKFNLVGWQRVISSIINPSHDEEYSEYVLCMLG